MRSLHFQLTLLSDAVVSASAATAGGHQSLDYLPGSTLMGIAASRLYQPGADSTETIFHSQKVRFGDACAVDDSTHSSAPAPRSLFHPKDDEQATLGNVAAGWAIEPAHKNLRQGHVVQDSGQRVAMLEHRSAMKTAVDAETGRARDGHLFTYDTLAAGAVFRFRVDLDDDVPQDVDASIQEALTDGTVRVGRSRSAEFGKARIKSVAADAAPSAASTADDTVILWALSDLALRDSQTGAPTCEPEPQHFGLPAGAEWDAQRSVLSSRRYSPFHGHRRRPDLERQVIERGSVIAFKQVQGVDLAEVSSQLSAGVGDYREVGCGSVCVAPQWLQQTRVDLSSEVRSNGAAVAVAPVDEMFQILQSRHSRLEREREAIDLCRRWEDELIDFFGANRLPGNSQWGLWRTMAAATGSWAELHGQLFGDSGLLSQGVRQKQWANDLFKKTSVMDFLQNQIESSASEFSAASHLQAIRLLGARMPKRLSLARKQGGSR